MAAGIESAPITTVDKDKAISTAISDIEKELGKGTVIRMNERPTAYPHYPTGIYGVDYDVLGIGGLPKGRIVEIIGPEGSGKTTIALTTIAEAQRKGGKAAYVDVEHALDPEWMKTQGVNVDDLLVSQPDSGEAALRIVDRLVETNAFDVIVVDSVAALTPQAELDGEIGDSHVGQLARLMSQACRILKGKVARSGTLLIFINQIREKIGVTYGSPETTPGGRALKFYASVRLDIRRTAGVKGAGDEVTANKTKIKCIKNRHAAPFRSTEIELKFGKGYDKEGSLLTRAAELKVVEKSGAWWAYNGERLGQGHSNAADAVKERGLYDEILKKVRAAEEPVS